MSFGVLGSSNSGRSIVIYSFCSGGGGVTTLFVFVVIFRRETGFFAAFRSDFFGGDEATIGMGFLLINSSSACVVLVFFGCGCEVLGQLLVQFPNSSSSSL